MDQQSNQAEDAVANLKKDFKIVGKQRVHSWYAWAIVGIVFGMALGIVYVANRSAQFSASRADGGGGSSSSGNTKMCPFSKDITVYADTPAEVAITSADWSLAISYQSGEDKSDKAKKAEEKVMNAVHQANVKAIEKCNGSFNRQYTAAFDEGDKCDVAADKCTLRIAKPDGDPKCKLVTSAPEGEETPGFHAKEGKYISRAQSATVYFSVYCERNSTLPGNPGNGPGGAPPPPAGEETGPITPGGEKSNEDGGLLPSLNSGSQP